jgi:enoyl-[acyl-carrier protein] reductase I
MREGLLHGKKGIIFGALNEKSIAWQVALKAIEQYQKSFEECDCD